MPKLPAPQAFSELLIPWYVNGTLSEKEMDRVSTQVDTSPELAESVNKEMRLTELLRETSPDLSDLLEQKEQAFHQLQRKIQANRNAPSSRRVWYTSAAASVLVLALAAGAYRALLPQLSLPNNEAMHYKTLTTAPRTYAGPVLQVIFEPGTTPQELSEFMLENNMRLLNGPSQQGVYRLALPADADGESYAQRLKQHSSVLWAEAEAR